MNPNNLISQLQTAGKVEEWRTNLAQSIYTPDSNLRKLLDDQAILADDKSLLRSETSDYILQKTDADTFINNCLVYTDTEEHIINRFLDLALKLIKEEEQKAKGLVPNTNVGTVTKSDDTQEIKHSKTEETLMSLARPSAPKVVEIHEGFSKESLLNEIENPTQTVKTPEFALPKTKPATADILKNLVAKTNDTITPNTSTKEEVKKDEIDLTDIVDPFKADKKTIAPEKIESKLIFSNQTEIPSTKVNPDEIRANFDTKLNSVTANAPKESFKVVDSTTKHDPYREPVELW